MNCVTELIVNRVKAYARSIKQETEERKGTSKVPRTAYYPNSEGAETRQDERYRDTEIRISLSVLFEHD